MGDCPLCGIYDPELDQDGCGPDEVRVCWDCGDAASERAGLGDGPR